MKKISAIEEAFALHCRASGLVPVREHVFCPGRRWRFDFAFKDQMVAVELEGGIWTNGRHTRGSGVIGDMEKYNMAARLGWAVYRFDGGAVHRGEAIDFMVKVLEEKKKREAA